MPKTKSTPSVCPANKESKKLKIISEKKERKIDLLPKKEDENKCAASTFTPKTSGNEVKENQVQK